MIATTVPNSTTPESTLRVGLNPGFLLRLEGAALFIASIALYANAGGGWVMFIVLLLAPDLAMLGYLNNPRLGAMAYNAAHTYVMPLVLLGVGLATSTPLAAQLAFIWFAHISMDRMVGYGFKYSTAFKDTHLDRV
jgi:hypothetical protein